MVHTSLRTTAPVAPMYGLTASSWKRCNRPCGSRALHYTAPLPPLTCSRLVCAACSERARAFCAAAACAWGGSVPCATSPNPSRRLSAWKASCRVGTVAAWCLPGSPCSPSAALYTGPRPESRLRPYRRWRGSTPRWAGRVRCPPQRPLKVRGRRGSSNAKPHPPRCLLPYMPFLLPSLLLSQMPPGAPANAVSDAGSTAPTHALAAASVAAGSDLAALVRGRLREPVGRSIAFASDGCGSTEIDVQGASTASEAAIRRRGRSGYRPRPC